MKRVGRIVGLAAVAVFASPLSQGTAAEDLSGTYVYLQQTANVSRMPVVADMVATTRAVSLMSLTHDGKRLSGEGKLCDLNAHSSSSLVKIDFPPAFKRALPRTRIDAKVTGDGDQRRFSQSKRAMVLGANLKSPLGDKLPNEEKDPRVVDQDGDGHPGMTVKVRGIVKGDVYVVQRTVSTLKGAKAAGGFEGEIEFENEQNILDATSFMLKRRTRPEPDLTRSFFRLMKVKKSTTCEEALVAAARYKR